MGQAVIPDDWTNEYCAYSVCWPNSPQWLAVLRGVLVLPASGRFWDETTGVITEAQAVIRETFDHNLHLQEVLMSCNDATATALNNIANAIIQSNQSVALTILSQGNACCEQTIINQNGGVQGSTPQADDPETEVPIYGTQPPIGVPPGEYPEGYDSLEEYELDKCQVANLIVDGLIGSLRNLALITFTNIAGLAGLIVVAIVGLIAFPPAAIPMMVGFLLMAVGVFGALDSVADDIEANREQWVCAMFFNDNVTTVISVIADLIDTLIASIPITEPRAAAVKGIILLLLNSDTLNQLFRQTAHVNYPDADCSECGPMQWNRCTNTPIFGLEFDVDSVAGCGLSNGNCHAVLVAFDYDGSTFADGSPGYMVSITGAPSGSSCEISPGVPYNKFNYLTVPDINGAQTQVDNQITDTCYYQVHVIGQDNTPFTVTITLTPCEA